MRPLIGVTTSELRPSRLATTRRHGEPAHPEMALGMTYLRTLDAAGAIPVVLPPTGTDHLGPLLERLDGLCLSGGPDLDPAAYGAPERHTELGPTEPSLDAFELSLVRMGLQRGLPILAICRGSQALNVACGGTLHQHVPGHRQTEAATEPTHEVEIESRSRLHRMVRTRKLAVNSFHHQAVDVARRRPAGRRKGAGRDDRGDRGRRLRRRRAVARRDADGAHAALRGPRYGGFPYRTARRRLTSWAGCPPSACAASSSVSAR